MSLNLLISFLYTIMSKILKKTLIQIVYFF